MLNINKGFLIVNETSINNNCFYISIAMHYDTESLL